MKCRTSASIRAAHNNGTVARLMPGDDIGTSIPTSGDKEIWFLRKGHSEMSRGAKNTGIETILEK